MRSLLSLVAAIVISVSAIFLTQSGVALAGFHCVRIHAVSGGFSGNNNIQYVELRMDQPGQTLLRGHTIQFFDASGTLKAQFTFGAMSWNGLIGDSVLVATSEFNAAATGGTADVTFSAANTVGSNGGDPLHPVQLTGGTVVWANGGPTCGMLGPSLTHWRTAVPLLSSGPPRALCPRPARRRRSGCRT